ncbi:MAG: hypothetical protein GWP06_14575, partial [Actinobacteria bacterium]|nr:hypothetical protein [Actinomycetota bacterium]
MIRKASIDIGTNSTRLLITDIDSSGNFFPLLTKERITRLGDGFDASSRLFFKAMQRVLIVLKDYLDFCKNDDVTDIVIFATSATRDAVNRDEFVGKIELETGTVCRILSGDEEALFSFRGVISDSRFDADFLVCDIGGGSTEFIFGRRELLIDRKSLNIGSRRMMREFLHSDPVKMREISDLKAFIMGGLKRNFSDSAPVSGCVCVGGTATTLAMMDKRIDITEPQKVHHGELSRLHLLQIISELEKKTIRERQKIVGLHPERADVILAGAVIVHCIMDFYNLP